MVKVEHLFKSFRKSDGTIFNVISDITFTVSKGDFCCILGPSGCGKTTMLNSIAGLIPPDSGKITISNTDDIASIKIGYVFQKSRLLKWKTVKGNLEFVLKSIKSPKHEWEDKINYYLDLVGLRGFSNEYPYSLSLGMEKRISLARGLIIDPDLILMDEPFSSVDEITARELRRDLINIWEKERKTVIFVTHNVSEAIFLGNKIILLSKIPTKISDTFEVNIGREARLNDPMSLEMERTIISKMESSQNSD
jgi:NitT/TauT family transport system ATP-binding protein